MYRYVGRRLLQSLVVLAGLSVLLFTLLVYTPGDPVEIIASTQPDIRAEDIARLRRYYGLDDPVWVRYVKWVRTVGTGDLGISRTYGQPVTRLIRQRLGNTLQLLTAAFLIAFTIGVTVGIYSALHQYSAMDYLATLLSFAGLAMPVFWLGIIVILVFAVWLPWFPAGGILTPGVAPGWPAVLDRLWHLALPTAVLAAAGTATADDSSQQTAPATRTRTLGVICEWERDSITPNSRRLCLARFSRDHAETGHGFSGRSRRTPRTRRLGTWELG